MTHPINYAYYPLGKSSTRDHGVIYSRCDSIDAAWNRDVKGVPVPFTGGKKWRKGSNGSGVSASSRMLSHYYADEGEKGRYVRKLVRNRERALWLAEWKEEQEQEGTYDVDGFDVAEYDWTDYERLTDPYDYDYYYGENDNDPTDYDPGPYNVYDYVDFDPYDFEDYGSYCAHCGGECEL